jgi:hypothetical protein
MTLVELLAERAMTLATEAFDDDAAVGELCRLANGDLVALDQACDACLARDDSLAARGRAIGLLARVRYGDFPEALPGQQEPSDP